jgi:hypothetical protein
MTARPARLAALVLFCVALAVAPGASGSTPEVFGPAGGNYPLGQYPFFVTVGDLDGDSAKDLVVPNSGDDTVSMFLGDGRGGFRGKRPLLVGTAPLVSAVADLDDDGRQDVAIAGGNTTTILLNRGGKFSQSRIDLGSTIAMSIVARDLEQDGHVDLAIASRGWIKVVILRGRGDGTFSREPDLPFPNDNGIPIGINAGDFTSDGYPDLVVTDRYFQDIVIYASRGDGTFEPGRRIDLVVSMANNIAVGDFDENGHLDMATEGEEYRNQVRVLLGNGDGTFEQRHVQLSNQQNAVALAVTAGDFNGDCHVDIATADGGTGEMPSIGVLLGRGDGTFEHAQQFEAGTMPHFLAAADFNGDGADDLAIPNRGYANGTLSIALALGRTGCG